MHDLSYFREHLAEFEQMAANRGVQIDFDGFRALDRERRERITAAERLKAERNRASEEIARRKRAGENADALLAEMKRVSEEIKRADERIAELDARLARFHAGRAQSAARLGARRPRRIRQCRGAPLGRAAEIRFRAAAALGSRRARRHSRSAARRENRRRALCAVSRTGRAAGARAWRISFWIRTRRTATRNICRHFW